MMVVVIMMVVMREVQNVLPYSYEVETMHKTLLAFSNFKVSIL